MDRRKDVTATPDLSDADWYAVSCGAMMCSALTRQVAISSGTRFLKQVTENQTQSVSNSSNALQ